MRVAEARIVSESSRIGVLDADHWIGSMGAPPATRFGGALFVWAESHRLIHDSIHSFVAKPTYFDSTDLAIALWLFRASELERETKHGTPAASVAGVYFYVRQRLAASASASFNVFDRSTSGTCCRSRN